MAYFTGEPIDLDGEVDYSSSEEENDDDVEYDHHENARLLTHRLSYIGQKSLDMLSLPSRPNLQNRKLLHKKSLRVLQTALQQTQFDPTGFRDDVDHHHLEPVNEEVTSARSDRTDSTATRFTINDDLPASEQQKICTTRVISDSETLVTDIKVLLKDNLIEFADKEKQISGLLDKFVSLVI